MIVLQYAVESCRRYLRKQGQLNVFAKTLLRYFGRLSNVHEEKHQSILEKMYEELFSEEEDAEMRNRLDYLDVKDWLEKRVGTRPDPWIHDS